MSAALRARPLSLPAQSGQRRPLRRSVKAVFVAFTALSLAALWGAIAADVGATLLVTFIALRLLRPTAVSGREERTAGMAPGDRMAGGR